MHKLRLYGFLVGLMVAVLLTCDCLAFKVITIYGFNFSASGLIFPLRFLISNAIENAILVLVSYPVNFYSLFSVIDIVHIAINTWSYKMVCTLFLFPMAIYLSNFVKKMEQIDYYDYGVSYNLIDVFSMNATGKNHYASINS